MRRLISAATWVGTVAVVLIAVAMYAVPALFGWQFSTVLTGSMEPKLHVGSVAVVTPVDPDRLGVGDIISFDHDARRVTHRIVQVSGSAGQRSFTTKGDANNTVDAWQVPQSAVVGQVGGDVPFVGRLMLGVRSPIGAAILAGLFAALLFASFVSGGDRKKPASAHSPALT